MSDRVYPACALGRSTICLGRQLDHEVRKILFDVRDWLEKWPGATIAGFAIPPIGEGYPITLDVSDGIAAWTIRNSDTATAGHGMVQLVLLGKNGEKLHSANTATQIGTSVAASAGTTPPDAAKLWFEELLEKIRQLEENGVTDEQIGEALDEYMKEHPIGGVKPEDVEEAVRTALKEAKDSGEFDGKDGETGPQGPAGKDGFSPVITVTNITGGHRVTITDANGTKSFDVLDGTGGSGEGSGAPGQDGFSPIISVIKIEGGHKVTITDATGTSEFDVMDGKNGEDGSAANVIDDATPSTEKTYSGSKIDELINAQKEAIDEQGEVIAGKANDKDLAAVAKSGSYNDLSNKPTIPTVPTALKNPNALTLTGAVSATYDGSTPVSVEIPAGGGGGASGVYEETLLLSGTRLTTDVAGMLDTGLTWGDLKQYKILQFTFAGAVGSIFVGFGGPKSGTQWQIEPCLARVDIGSVNMYIRIMIHGGVVAETFMPSAKVTNIDNTGIAPKKGASRSNCGLVGFGNLTPLYGNVLSDGAFAVEFTDDARFLIYFAAVPSADAAWYLYGGKW